MIVPFSNPQIRQVAGAQQVVLTSRNAQYEIMYAGGYYIVVVFTPLTSSSGGPQISTPMIPIYYNITGDPLAGGLAVVIPNARYLGPTGDGNAVFST